MAVDAASDKVEKSEAVEAGEVVAGQGESAGERDAPPLAGTTEGVQSETEVTPATVTDEGVGGTHNIQDKCIDEAGAGADERGVMVVEDAGSIDHQSENEQRAHEGSGDNVGAFHTTRDQVPPLVVTDLILITVKEDDEVSYHDRSLDALMMWFIWFTWSRGSS